MERTNSYIISTLFCQFEVVANNSYNISFIFNILY